MSPRQLLDAGRLNDALQALAVEVRDNPTDVQRRIFLFELLSFAGEYDRAEKHLDVLAQENQSAALGCLLYRAAIHAERLRHEMFTKKEYPTDTGPAQVPPSQPGLLNGHPFDSFSDADSRIGKRMEVFAAGSYLWIPVEHIESIEMASPRLLRDLLWPRATIRTGPAFSQRELGEVFVPALSPFSFKYPDDAVRLGRTTVWDSDESGDDVPFGQKMFLVDGEEVPVLEVRTLQFKPSVGSS